MALTSIPSSQRKPKPKKLEPQKLSKRGRIEYFLALAKSSKKKKTKKKSKGFTRTKPMFSEKRGTWYPGESVRVWRDSATGGWAVGRLIYLVENDAHVAFHGTYLPETIKIVDARKMKKVRSTGNREIRKEFKASLNKGKENA